MKLLFSKMSEHSFAVVTTSSDCFNWILWKTILFDDELMQIVFQKICTCISSMTVVNSKERAFWPILNFFFAFWSHDVKNNRNSVFIVGSNNPLISVCCIRMNDAILLRGELRTFFIRKRKLDRIQIHSNSKKNILNDLARVKLFAINDF